MLTVSTDIVLSALKEVVLFALPFNADFVTLMAHLGELTTACWVGVELESAGRNPHPV